MDRVKVFVNAITEQAIDRAGHHTLDIESYIALRRNTGAMRPVFALIEFANGLDLPNEVIEHPLLQSMEDAANDFVAWTNVR